MIDGSDNRSPEQFKENICFLDTLDYQGSCLVVVNKKDICRDAASRLRTLHQLSHEYQEKGLSALASKSIAVSALRGDHLDELNQQIERTLHGGTIQCQGLVLALTIRQREALNAGIENLRRACLVLSDPESMAAELAALELREALDHLGEITGEVVTEEVLGRIFNRFCIGK